MNHHHYSNQLFNQNNQSESGHAIKSSKNDLGHELAKPTCSPPSPVGVFANQATYSSFPDQTSHQSHCTAAQDQADLSPKTTTNIIDYGAFTGAQQFQDYSHLLSYQSLMNSLNQGRTSNQLDQSSLTQQQQQQLNNHFQWNSGLSSPQSNQDANLWPRSLDNLVQISRMSNSSLPSSPSVRKQITKNIHKDRKCAHCGTQETTMWRKHGQEHVCNPCGLYFKLHGKQRPASMYDRHSHRRKRTAKSSNDNSTISPHVNLNDSLSPLAPVVQTVPMNNSSSTDSISTLYYNQRSATLPSAATSCDSAMSHQNQFTVVNRLQNFDSNQFGAPNSQANFEN